MKLNIGNLTSLRENLHVLLLYFSMHAAVCIIILFLSKCKQFGDNNQHLQLLSRGGLTIPSQILADFTCRSFAALGSADKAIEAEQGSAGYLAEHVLSSKVVYFQCACSLGLSKGLQNYS